jgi:hypothetical protein
MKLFVEHSSLTEQAKRLRISVDVRSDQRTTGRTPVCLLRAGGTQIIAPLSQYFLAQLDHRD